MDFLGFTVDTIGVSLTNLLNLTELHRLVYAFVRKPGAIKSDAWILENSSSSISSNIFPVAVPISVSAA